MTVLAHGVGTRTDLPIPVGLALFGAGAAILLTFAVLLTFWRRPRLGGAESGRPLPTGVQRVLDGTAVRRGLQAVALGLAVLVVVVAFAGPDDTPHNIAPWAFYVTFWVGLVPASLLLGPVWRVVNPLRLLHRGLRLALPRAPWAKRVESLGLWPAAGFLVLFLWLELVSPHRSDPAVVPASPRRQPGDQRGVDLEAVAGGEPPLAEPERQAELDGRVREQEPADDGGVGPVRRHQLQPQEHEQ